jgi:hypothetical protein
MDNLRAQRSSGEGRRVVGGCVGDERVRWITCESPAT